MSLPIFYLDVLWFLDYNIISKKYFIFIIKILKMRGGEEMKKLLVALMLLAPTMTFAQDAETDFGTTKLGGLSTASSKDLVATIESIVNLVLTFLGGIAVLLFLYGGFKWFTSQGNSDQIDAAKKIMGSAVVGLAIIFASYAAAQYIITQLYDRTIGTVGA
jgi:hypothetical protein